MTRASLREYAAVQRERYLQATRAEKHRLLDEVVAVTGMHRKAAIRLLRRAPRAARPRPVRGGRPRALRAGGRGGGRGPVAGQRADRRASPAPLRARAARSPGAVRRSAAPARRGQAGAAGQPADPGPPARGRPRPVPAGGAPRTTRPGTWLKQQIPIRTFTDWDRRAPGLLRGRSRRPLRQQHQGLLPLHALRGGRRDQLGRAASACGARASYRVAAGVQPSAQRLPIALRRARQRQRLRVHQPGPVLTSAGGSGITFTRSRAWKKNDSAHVEQKNGAIVRHLIGYDRFASKRAYAQLARVYALARLHVNFFQPVEKLVTKHRDGARVHRVYDRAQTPYQRLCAAGVLPPAKRAELDALYGRSIRSSSGATSKRRSSGCGRSPPRSPAGRWRRLR